MHFDCQKMGKLQKPHKAIAGSVPRNSGGTEGHHFIMSPARSFANFAPSGTGEPSATSAVS